MTDTGPKAVTRIGEPVESDSRTGSATDAVVGYDAVRVFVPQGVKRDEN